MPLLALLRQSASARKTTWVAAVAHSINRRHTLGRQRSLRENTASPLLLIQGLVLGVVLLALGLYVFVTATGTRGSPRAIVYAGS